MREKIINDPLLSKHSWGKPIQDPIYGSLTVEGEIFYAIVRSSLVEIM